MIAGGETLLCTALANNAQCSDGLSLRGERLSINARLQRRECIKAVRLEYSLISSRTSSANLIDPPSFHTT